MPTYEYVCQDCSHNFEEFQKMSDEPIEVCPECKGAVVRKIGTGSGFVFKDSSVNYNSNSCCGSTSPCDTPKRCCTNNMEE